MSGGPAGQRGERATAVTTSAPPTSDPVELLERATSARDDAEPDLSEAEAHYVAVARSANTLRGYRSDWAEFTTWCGLHGHPPMPAPPAAVAGYLIDMAGWGAKVGTMSRRLSAIRFAHSMRNLPDPTEHARVVAVWEGIRREHSAPPEQATPLMPPDLQAVLDACPTVRTFKTPGRADEPSRAGARDRALILVGFVAALRRSELVALDIEQLSEHPRGKVIAIPRSKTNQRGEQTELVVLPRSGNPARCPVTALEQWLQLAAITGGPVFRPVSKANRPLARRLTAAAANDLLQAAVLRAGITPRQDPTHRRCTKCAYEPTEQEAHDAERCPRCKAKLPPHDFGGYSAHSLRAGFVTHAHLRGASDRAIAHQTRHRSLATIGTYVRVQNAWRDNAALDLGL